MSKLTNWVTIRGMVMTFSEKAFMVNHMRQFKFSRDEYMETKTSLMAWIEGEAKPELEKITKSIFYTKASGSALLSAVIKFKNFLTVYHGLGACVTDDDIRKELFEIQELLLLDSPLGEE